MAALRRDAAVRRAAGPGARDGGRKARRVDVAAGEVVVRQGDPGAAYFAVISGNLVVSRDGEDRAELTRGSAFGGPRSSERFPGPRPCGPRPTLSCLAVDREPFLTAVTGHGTTHERASSIASRHLDPQLDGQSVRRSSISSENRVYNVSRRGTAGAPAKGSNGGNNGRDASQGSLVVARQRRCCWAWSRLGGSAAIAAIPEGNFFNSCRNLTTGSVAPHRRGCGPEVRERRRLPPWSHWQYRNGWLRR